MGRVLLTMNTRKRLSFIVLLFSVTSLSVKAQTPSLIVVHNQYFPKPGKEEAVYQWRLHASEVRVKLGLPKGRVLKKVTGNGGPSVIWECEYPSLESRENDVAVLDRSEEFKKVQEHMSTLIDKFERFVFEVK